jgi:hypothetical protein
MTDPLEDPDRQNIPDTPEAPQSSAHQEPAMLDVHPPHEAAHSLKDFFIHIITIVIGLLIAIGLEQTVEHFHHHHQIAETREALRAERENNRTLLAKQAVYFRRETAALQNNLDVLLYLQRHPGTPQAQLPGILTWHSALTGFSDAAWVTAQQSGITALMPHAEVEAYSALYAQFHLINQGNIAYWLAVSDALQYGVQDPDPSHLSPEALAHENELTKIALIKHLQHGVAMNDLSEAYSDFSPGIQRADLVAIIHSADEFNPALAAPLALTIQKIDAAGKANDYFPQASSPIAPNTK